MKVEMGKQYRTRDGREVRIYAVDGVGAFPVHGALRNSDGWHFFAWCTSGAVRTQLETDSADLVEVRPQFRFERWFNVYRGGPASPHSNQEQANTQHCGGRIACVKVVIEGEEGDGLEGRDV